MQRFLIWTALASVMAVVVVGCQSAKTDYSFRCTHRAVEAGFCKELNDPAPDPIKEPS